MLFQRCIATILLISISLTSIFTNTDIKAVSRTSITKQSEITQTIRITMDQTEQINCFFESPVTANTLAASQIKSFLKDGKNYLLLPSYVTLNSVLFNLETRNETNAFWNGTLIEQGKPIKVTQGEHILSINEKQYPIVIQQSKYIEAMFMTTDDDLEYIHSDKSNKTTGKMSLITASGTLEYDDTLTQVKTRGNTTFYDPKKPYQIKLSQSAPLLGMGQAKTWILLANAFDESGIRNKLVYDLARETGLMYSPNGNWVDLYINGEYHGNYLLSEKIEIAKNRVDIANLEKETEKANPGTDLSTLPSFGSMEGQPGKNKGVQIPTEPFDITGGYLLEVDVLSRYAEEASGFVTSRNKPVVIKSPEYASKRQTEYIQDLFQKFEDALFTEDGIHPVTKKSYSEYFDMDSFVKRYIIDEITRNVDAGLTSSFYYKPEGNDQPVYSGPCWDFDTSLGRAWPPASQPEGLGYPYFSEDRKYNWYEQLYKRVEFRNLIKTIYNETFKPSLDHLMNVMIPQYLELLEPSLRMNATRWPGDKYSIGYEKDQEIVVSFLRKRIAWLNKTWTNELEPVPSITPSIAPTPAPTIIPSTIPSVAPTIIPPAIPSTAPTLLPSVSPSLKPVETPTITPTITPSMTPTVTPTATPSIKPTVTPIVTPSIKPTVTPTVTPSIKPTVTPIVTPTMIPTVTPSTAPSATVPVVPTKPPVVTPSIRPSITLNKTSVTLYETGKNTAQLKASVQGQSKTVTYTSSNSKIAKISSTGTITAIKHGTAIITAKANNITATCKVVVKATSLKLNRSEAVIYTVKKNTVQMKPATTGYSKTISYTSSNSKIATVNRTGKVTAKKAGSAIITIRANGRTARCKIIVKNPTLTVSKSKITLRMKSKTPLKVKATPSNKVTFTSSNSKIATVSKSGVVTGIRTGTTTIKVKCNGIVKAVKVTVKK